MIAVDLAILNDGLQKIGYYKSEFISPFIINDVLTTPEGNLGQMSMPVEFWLSPDGKKTYMVVRSAVIGGQMRAFSEQLRNFVQTNGFADVAILTATISPVKRERESNRQIPEIFAYCNNYLYKQDFYSRMKIRKFGWWISDVKKKPHQELRELAGEGWASRLLKEFNKSDIPACIFTIFCTGGVDFVGGFVFYNLLKRQLFN